jgi:chloride channel protein, CIC family
MEDIFDGLKFPEYLKAVIGGLILGVISLLFPQILSVGYDAIDLALGQAYAWWLMIVLVLCKILATSITIGSGGSGGIFAPSLFMGAMAGGFFGAIVHNFFPSVTASPGAYSIVGMGAVVSATTHGPLTALLMLFEMTGDYKIILPLMITCIISNIVGRQLLKESIYTLKLMRRGINLEEGKEVNVLKSIEVGEVMNTKVETITEALGLERLAEIISKSKYNSFPVVKDGNKLTGIISFYDYNEAIFDENLKGLVVAKDIATSDVVTISTDDNLYNALEKITFKDFAILPVVSPNDPAQLMGVLTRRDIMGAYNKAVIKKSLYSEA